ncbi:uncharacterized protein EI90DRAFT_2498689 [Cantharellus anzutake]|uniref:uncharacterized protein n=1 Tax=Cantharellus anzutake TaxID=1750568 RepID=UPI001907C5C9|nr:uncharacterized protein EI90DRAFT_2498689 [Cantharellus anzutake]KAF8321847.1 hypothetical protein EI90DRAFT_2498689 [Cantharellus anzutake]
MFIVLFRFTRVRPTDLVAASQNTSDAIEFTVGNILTREALPTEDLRSVVARVGCDLGCLKGYQPCRRQAESAGSSSGGWILVYFASTSKALVALVKTPGSNVWKFRVIRWTAEESRESLIPKRVELSNSQGLPTRGARPGRVQLTAPSGRSRASLASEAILLFIETYTIL